jgi:hypothetical protein
MTPFSPSARYFLYRDPADVRKNFDGLCGLVERGLGRDPASGEVFVFLNRRRTHVKLLAFDRSGFVLYYKRLEEGMTFRPIAATQSGSLLLGGRVRGGMGGCVRTGFGGRNRPYRVAAFRPESVAPFDRNTQSVRPPSAKGGGQPTPAGGLEPWQRRQA